MSKTRKRERLKGKYEHVAHIHTDALEKKAEKRKERRTNEQRASERDAFPAHAASFLTRQVIRALAATSIYVSTCVCVYVFM